MTISFLGQNAKGAGQIDWRSPSHVAKRLDIELWTVSRCGKTVI